MHDCESKQSNALYLLGFSPASTTRERSANAASIAYKIESGLGDLLDEYGVECITEGSIVAWFKQIDRSQFEGAAGEANLSSIEWLTPRVLAHEAVVSLLCNDRPFYPSRFGTLFSSKEKVSVFATAASDRLMEFFARVDDRREWSIKILGDQNQAALCVAQELGFLNEGRSGGGMNYLKLRQLQRDRSAATGEKLRQHCQIASQNILDHFSDVVLRPVRARASETDGLDLLSNMAVLASSEQVNELADFVSLWNAQRWPESAVRLELAGPFPAYSFCPSLEQIDTQARAA